MQTHFRSSEFLSLIYILFLLEIPQNFALCANECLIFDKNFGKNRSLLANVCLLRIRRALKNKIKLSNRQNDSGVDRFEKLVKYDFNINNLKYPNKRSYFGNNKSIFTVLETFILSRFKTTDTKKSLFGNFIEQEKSKTVV